MASMSHFGPVDVQTKTNFRDKQLAGCIGSLIAEWTDNVLSATHQVGPATGELRLENINGKECLILESETLIGDGTASSFRQMVSSGPSNLATGVMNEKGVGTRLLIAALGGKEYGAAELLLISADARDENMDNVRGIIGRVGPKVDKIWRDAQNDEHALDGMARCCAEVKKVNGSFKLDYGQGHQTHGAEKVTTESGHPYQRERDHGATEDALLEAFEQC